jgi:excisionase family DNA binding protein
MWEGLVSMNSEIGSNLSVEIMTVHELALYLKTSDTKIYRLARMREIPAFRIGNSWRFKKKMIDVWARQRANLALGPVDGFKFYLPEEL